MTKAGLNAAIEFGRHLPFFENQQSAERELFSRRDKLLKKIIDIAELSDGFIADFTPDSLKSLERWYFELYENNAFDNLGVDRAIFEAAMAVYFAEVVVRNHSEFRWIVAEYAFESGKYEIGIKKRLHTIMIGGFKDHYAKRNNKRQQSIWRLYGQYTR